MFQFVRGNSWVTQRGQQELQRGGMGFPGIICRAGNQHFGDKIEECYIHWTVGITYSIHFWSENLRGSLGGIVGFGERQEKSEVTWEGWAEKIL